MNYLSSQLPPEALTDCCKLSCLPQNLPRPRCACQEKLPCLEPLPRGPASASLPVECRLNLILRHFIYSPDLLSPLFVLKLAVHGLWVDCFSGSPIFNSGEFWLNKRKEKYYSSVYKTQFANLSQQSKVDWKSKCPKLSKFDFVWPQSAVLSVPPDTFGDMVTNWLTQSFMRKNVLFYFLIPGCGGKKWNIFVLKEIAPA